MKKNVLAIMIMAFALIFSACTKNEDDMLLTGGKVNDNNFFTKVELHYSTGMMTKSTNSNKMLVESGGEITGVIDYFFSFWLEPANGEEIAEGTFKIVNATNQVVYQSINPENGIDIKFPTLGTYTLTVTGTFGGNPFNFTGITVNVVEPGEVPEDPVDPDPVSNSLTSPVNLSNLAFSGNSNVTVDIAVKKEAYLINGTNWFFVKRTNGTGFQQLNTVTNDGDSIRFTLIMPKTNGTVMEFNIGCYLNGSPMWMTPSAGETPSILAGTSGNPYSDSENYFAMKLTVSGQNLILKTISGEIVLTNDPTLNPPATIPGNAGDGEDGEYTIRWSGYTHFFKTTEVSPAFRYKVDEAWTYLVVSPYSENAEYFKVNIPSNTSGQMHFQFGKMSGTTFIPDYAGMAPSMYYDAEIGHLVKNI